MTRLFKEILGNPVPRLLAFVPVAIVAQAQREPEALLFVLPVLAIVRMAVGEAA